MTEIQLDTYIRDYCRANTPIIYETSIYFYQTWEITSIESYDHDGTRWLVTMIAD